MQVSDVLLRGPADWAGIRPGDTLKLAPENESNADIVDLKEGVFSRVTIALEVHSPDGSLQLVSLVSEPLTAVLSDLRPAQDFQVAFSNADGRDK